MALLSAMPAGAQDLGVDAGTSVTVGDTAVTAGISATLGGASPAATPELGSLALFGTGAVGMVGYALVLAGRRR
jgi:hypothetical protein